VNKAEDGFLSIKESDHWPKEKPDITVGANKMSLNEVKKAFEE